MSNNEIIYKINTVVKYLKDNNGYKYKLYNHSCPGYGKPDSNIVEYAEDIEELLEYIFSNNNKGTFIKLEICKMIFDNLQLFDLNDNKLKKLKKYIVKHINDDITSTPSDELIELCQEALFDLLTTDCLYDFRNLE